MKPRLAISSGHGEIMTKECSHGAASAAVPPGLTLTQHPGEVGRGELQQPKRGRGQRCSQRPSHMRNGMNASRNTKPGARLRRADCAAVKAVWKGAVENGNQGNKAEILHGLSIILL